MKYLIALSAFVASVAAWEVTIYENANYGGWSKSYSNSWNTNQKILLSGYLNDATSSFIFSGDRNDLDLKVNSITLYKNYDSDGNCNDQIGYSCGSWSDNQISAANNDQLSCIQISYHVFGC
ncbi:hypothetical protein EMPS_07805 [Entomortierella parvispora]|uniref:Uncharacterized protein n=1 Tax=Entomortierella parvispora TaxID=205924 RepID=A0A9P3HF38_9FUNG|nr:hypothetical protein EMPS_07805 [Entomortierella parvispora]